MEWKADKEWSYEWYNYYTIVGYQIITDEKAGLMEINQPKYFNGVNFSVEKDAVFVSAKNQQILESLFLIRYEGKWEKIDEKLLF